MNIVIRDVNPIVVKKLDRLAKENGLSREEFLRNQLEVISVLDLIQEQKNDVNKMFEELKIQLQEILESLLLNERNYLRMLRLFSYITEIDLAKFKDFYDSKDNRIY